MLVSVSNFLLLYVFWESVGVCSYLLIGFWYEKPSAADACKKAFLVNRVGDFGFALALFLIWTCYGTLNFHDTAGVHGVLGQLRLASGDFVTGWPAISICLLLLVGACMPSAPGSGPPYCLGSALLSLRVRDTSAHHPVPSTVNIRRSYRSCADSVVERARLLEPSYSLNPAARWASLRGA